MNARLALAAAAAVTLVMVLVPQHASAYAVSFLINMLMYVALAGAWNLFSGLTGYASLGHGLFFGIGAYAFAIATVTLGQHPIVGFAAAAAAAAVAGVVVGLVLLTTRIRIAYFAIVMLGLNEIAKTIVANIKALGSSYGFTLPAMPSPLVAYYALLVLALTVTGIAWAIRRLPIGLALRAVLADEVAAEMTGVRIVAHKMAMFVTSAVLTALCGGVIAWYWSYIDPFMAFDLSISFEMVVMTMFGGFGTVMGPVVGAVVMCIVKEFLSTSLPHLHTIVFGGLVLVVIIWRPGGVVELFQGLGRPRRRRPPAEEAAL